MFRSDEIGAAADLIGNMRGRVGFVFTKRECSVGTADCRPAERAAPGPGLQAEGRVGFVFTKRECGMGIADRRPAARAAPGASVPIPKFANPCGTL